MPQERLGGGTAGSAALNYRDWQSAEDTLSIEVSAGKPCPFRVRERCEQVTEPLAVGSASVSIQDATAIQPMFDRAQQI